MLATTWVQIVKAVLLMAGTTLLSVLVLAQFHFSLFEFFDAIARVTGSFCAGGAPAQFRDPRTGKVFVSNGTFVEGARPDVEGLTPTTPFNYRAGWGYLLLTWGLWAQGNGTYTLHAFAFDLEGQVAAIGGAPGDRDRGRRRGPDDSRLVERADRGPIAARV